MRFNIYKYIKFHFWNHQLVSRMAIFNNIFSEQKMQNCGRKVKESQCDNGEREE